MLTLRHEVVDDVPITRESTGNLFDTIESYLLTDRESLYDALTRGEGSGLQLKETRTAIEVLCLTQFSLVFP